jgi:hypothetical protein
MLNLNIPSPSLLFSLHPSFQNLTGALAPFQPSVFHSPFLSFNQHLGQVLDIITFIKSRSLPIKQLSHTSQSDPPQRGKGTHSTLHSIDQFRVNKLYRRNGKIASMDVLRGWRSGNHAFVWLIVRFFADDRGSDRDHSCLLVHGRRCSNEHHGTSSYGRHWHDAYGT